MEFNGNIGPNYYVVKEHAPHKNRQKEIYLSFENFYDLDLLIKEFSVCSYYTRYSVIVRVCYGIDNKTEWKSLGEQIGLYFENMQDLEDFINLFQDTIINRIEQSMELYRKDEEEILFLQILVYNVNYTDIAVKRKNMFNTNTLSSHKDLLNVSKTTKVLNSILPLTMDTKHFGIQLNKVVPVSKKGVGNKLFLTLVDGKQIDFIERINKFSTSKIESLSSNTMFYQNMDKNVIITVESRDCSNIINIYSMQGMKIHSLIDTKLLDFGNTNVFTRKIGNVVVYINEKGIYKKEIHMDLEPVYPNRVSGPQARMIHPDWMVGTMDLETFVDKDNLSKPYAAGFYTNKDLNTFYVDKDLHFDSVVLKCIDSMLSEKYNNYIFYIHNMGRFDIVFILKILLKANSIYPDKYSYNLIFREDLILSIEISTKIKGKKCTIKLVDSYNLLNSSLSNLCKTFDTEIKKSFFPYDFVNRYNLFYSGDKPDKEYYNDIEQEEYEDIPEVWSMEDETIKYLNNDLISLYNVIDKFKYQIYVNYKTHITKSLTLSSLAMQIYLKEYYNNDIPLINKTSLYNDIKKSYYGGITEVYIPYGKDLYYYDVNSLYPYSALNSMPGLNCFYIDIIDKDICECLDDNFFGFYYCDIETTDNYIGLLPVRTKTGLIMPLGKISGWFFSEELKFAYQNGYKIHVVNGYQFSRSHNVFDKYVNEFYRIKSTTKDSVMRAISKSLLNNLLGRFGLNIEKHITELLSMDEYLELLQYKKVRNIKYIEDKVLVTHDDQVSLDICNSHDVDYKETLLNNLKRNKRNSNNKFKENIHHDVSIAISSAITSYSRIHMNKIKLYILSKGGLIYYTDTDSIVTNIKLDNHLVGSELGKLKLEHEIEEGYFISTKTYAFKTYAFKTKEGKVVIKAKGVTKSNLSLDDFRKLYLGEKVATIRNESIKDFSNGSVTINVPRKITLSGNVYNKRTKIFDNNNIWIDTRPITQNKYHTSARQKIDLNSNLMCCIISIVAIIFLFMRIIYTTYIGNWDIDLEINNNILSNYENFKEVNSPLLETSKPNILDLKKYDFISLDNKFNNYFMEESKNNLDIPNYKESKILETIKQKHNEDNISELKQSKEIIEKLYFELNSLRQEVWKMDKMNNDALDLINGIERSRNRNTL